MSGILAPDLAANIHPTPPVDWAEVTRIQDRAVAESADILETEPAVLIQAPTAAGKTRINVRLVEALRERMGRNPVVLSLTHRDLLTAQGQDAFAEWAPNSPLTTSLSMDGKLDQSTDVRYANVQTARARLDKLEPVDILAIDEAHHASDKEGADHHVVIQRLLELNPKMKIIAVTATPDRPDDKGLHPVLAAAPRVTIEYGELARAGQILLPTTKQAAISAKGGGTLAHVAAKHYRPEKDANSAGLSKALRQARTDTFFEEAIDAWERGSKGGRTIAFAESIEDAKKLADEANARGHKVDLVHSNAGRAHNKEALARYGRGELDMVVSVKMIDEGLDVPATRCVLIIRGTTSLTEFDQMNGRAMRMGSNPEFWNQKPIVIDCGASTMLHGAVERRAAVADYYQRLRRGELSKENPAKQIEHAALTETRYTPWRQVSEQPTVLAISDGKGVFFAIENRDLEGKPRYTLVEAQEMKGRHQVTFMKDADGKPLNGITLDRLQAVEMEKMLPARRALLRMEGTKDPAGRSLIDERIETASEQNVSSVVAFATLARGASKGR